MFKKLRKVAVLKLGSSLLRYLVYLYSLTFRLTIVNEKPWRDYVEQGGKAVLCCWHQQFFISVYFARRYLKYKVVVMVSRSADGDLAARVVEAAKAYAVRGSSSQGGASAMKEMIERLKEKKSLVAFQILDGPRGPAGKVKPGIIAIGARADAIIVPVTITADRAWYMKSWDRFMIPKPFAHVRVNFFPFMKVPPFEENSEEFEQQRQILENTLAPGLKR